MAKKPESPDAQPRYRILHDMVGRHGKGDVVTVEQFGEGAEIDYLLEVGAIESADAQPEPEPAPDEPEPESAEG